MGARFVPNPVGIASVKAKVLLAAEQTAFAVRTDVETAAVVPKEVGTLEGTSFIDRSQKPKGRFSLVYVMPYARRLYWHPEYNFRTDKNANARGEWLEPWINGEKRNFARETFKKLMRKQMGR